MPAGAHQLHHMPAGAHQLEQIYSQRIGQFRLPGDLKHKIYIHSQGVKAIYSDCLLEATY